MKDGKYLEVTMKWSMILPSVLIVHSLPVLILSRKLIDFMIAASFYKVNLYKYLNIEILNKVQHAV